MKNCFKTILLFLSFVSTYALQIKAQEPDSASPLKPLVEAERSFAKMAAAEGVRNAFVHNLADKALMFRNGPINGKELWEKRKPAPFLLKWEPEFADIAASGDFGFTTGPWEIQEYRPLTESGGYGYFTSVWKKQTDGTWKVVLDIGTSNPKPAAYTYALQYPPGADKARSFTPVAKLDAVRDELIQRDAALGRSTAASFSAPSFFEALSSDARLQRNEYLPTTHRDTIAARLSGITAWESQPIGGDVASSGDLGYTYGTYTIRRGEASEKGHYVRFWKRNEKNQWKITLDLTDPSPEVKK